MAGLLLDKLDDSSKIILYNYYTFYRISYVLPSNTKRAVFEE